MDWKSPRTWVFWAGVGLVGMFVVASNAEGDRPVPGTDSGAFAACTGYVEEQLRSPSTAQFPKVSDATTTSTEQQDWTIRSHVDAQNAFGAEVRTNWRCDVRYLGRQRWRGTATLSSS